MDKFAVLCVALTAFASGLYVATELARKDPVACTAIQGNAPIVGAVNRDLESERAIRPTRPPSRVIPSEVIAGLR